MHNGKPIELNILGLIPYSDHLIKTSAIHSQEKTVLESLQKGKKYGHKWVNFEKEEVIRVQFYKRFTIVIYNCRVF